MLVPDTHAHLADPAFDADRDEVVERAREQGVGRILAVGTDLVSSLAAVQCAHDYDIVYAAVGIHPHEAHTFDAEAQRVKELLSLPKVVAVGEIGLDRVRQFSPLDVQMHAFRAQLEWARERGLPVSVHDREADDEVFDALAGFDGRVILHCFSGPQEVAVTAANRGYVLSFAGNVTFKNAGALRQVAQTVPDQQLLIETDSPLLAPQPWRGRRSEPAYVTAVCRTVAEARGQSPDEIALLTYATAERIFGWGAA